MEKIRRVSRKYYLRQIVACWMILSMIVVMPLNTAMAGPPVYTPVITDSGGANVTQSNMFTGIEVVTQETIMTSSNFNTLVGETVDFSQAEGISGAAVLNKISGGPTDYQGNLYSESDMSIFLINPAGILFGGGAVINTGALVASSLNLTDDDFREGLDTGVFNFTDGANAGIVENHGSISAETIALIGKTVLNTGALNGDYVVMAAGDTVKITGGPDLGDIIVEVTVPADWESGDDAYWVDHGDEGSGGSIDAQQVVLAAGDIWSSAMINATADGVAAVAIVAKGNIDISGDINVNATPGSDAVATVDIDAGGDVTVNSQVYAYAENSGEPAYNATATIDVDAGGDVGIHADVKAETSAEDSGDTDSTVIITADNLIVSEGGRVEAYAYADEGSGDGTAIIDIDAKGDVTISDAGSCDTIEAQAEILKAGSEPSGSAVAKTSIDAGGEINVNNAGVKAFASAKGTKGDEISDAEVHIYTIGGNGGDITIDADSKVHAKAITYYSEIDSPIGVAADSLVDIQSQQDVSINGMVKSHAKTEFCSSDDPYNEFGNTNADILIKAAGDVIVNNDEEKTLNGIVMSHAHGGKVNDSTTVVDAGGDVIVNDADEGSECLRDGAEIFAHANNGETNNALVNVIARGTSVEGEGDVLVKGQIKAMAHSCEDDVEDGSYLAYNADVKVSAARDVIVENGMILAEASNVYSNYREGVSALEHNATVTVSAVGDVSVTDSEVYAKSETEDESGDATATTTVAAANVSVTDSGRVKAVAKARNYSGDATANIDIVATGDVLVQYGSGSHIVADADATGNSGNALATVGVEAVNVTVSDHSEIRADAYASQSGNATADTDVLASGDVAVVYSSRIAAIAYAGNRQEADDTETMMTGGDATATTDVIAGGDVLVGFEDLEHRRVDSIGLDGGPDGPESASAIFAVAEVKTDDGTVRREQTDDEEEAGKLYVQLRDALAETTVISDGAVTVEEDGAIFAEADMTIKYGGGGSAPAPLAVDPPTLDPITYYILPGHATANTKVKAQDDITVYGSVNKPFGAGEIYADASVLYRLKQNADPGVPAAISAGYTSDASASVDLETCANVFIDGFVVAEADIFRAWDKVEADPQAYGNATAETIVKAFEDVIVNQGIAPERPDDDIDDSVDVSFQPDADFYWANGSIGSEASGGNTNSAETIILAKSDVIVNDASQPDIYITSPEFGSDGPESDAEVFARASNGYENNTLVGIATRDGDGEGDIIIGGQVESRAYDSRDEDSSNTAAVQMSAARDVIVEGGFARVGGIFAIDLDGPMSEQGGEILAAAGNGFSNTADIEVLAGRDIIVEGAEIEILNQDIYTAPQASPANGGLSGQIMARTYDGFENTSNVDLVAQRDVIIEAADVTEIDPFIDDNISNAVNLDYDGAQVLAQSRNGATNTSEVGLYAAGDVVVDGTVKAGARNGDFDSAVVKVQALGNIAGSGEIYANGREDSVSITFDTPVVNFVGYTNIEPVEGDLDIPEFDFDDWIDWTWCEECEDTPTPTPVAAAPLVQVELEIPSIEGCPVEMQAVAGEIGIDQATIQVSVGNALALNPSLQPCQACATIINAAGILRDEDGSAMAALSQVFNELAPTNAPFTPEMADSIVAAFAERAADDPQYATAMAYMDAFVDYVAALETGLGSPLDDSVAYVLEKHGAGITDGDNANIAAFVATRLESLAALGG